MTTRRKTIPHLRRLGVTQEQIRRSPWKIRNGCSATAGEELPVMEPGMAAKGS
jgi:hypothetical protein